MHFFSKNSLSCLEFMEKKNLIMPRTPLRFRQNIQPWKGWLFLVIPCYHDRLLDVQSSPDLRDDSRTREWSYHSQQLADKSLRYVTWKSEIKIRFSRNLTTNLFCFIATFSCQIFKNYYIISQTSLDQVWLMTSDKHLISFKIVPLNGLIHWEMQKCLH